MISDHEREAARVGMRALDQALVALGRPSVSQNPDFNFAEPVVGHLPNIVLEKRGVAPLRFVFGFDLDVWVGPFSEVILLTASEASFDLIQQRVAELLSSSIFCQAGRGSMVITLQLPGDEPWLRLKVRASGLSSELDSAYAPYAGSKRQ